MLSANRQNNSRMEEVSGPLWLYVSIPEALRQLAEL
jgi:hypothetical protein